MNDDKSNERVIASGWAEVAKASASSGAWLKWQPGQVIQVNVFGTPVFFEKTFEDGPKRRVRVDAFVPGEGVKIFEMAPTTLRDLAEERAAVKQPFEDALFSIKRIGDGMKTTYKMRYERQLTPQEIAARSDAGAAKGVEAGDPF